MIRPYNRLVTQVSWKNELRLITSLLFACFSSLMLRHNKYTISWTYNACGSWIKLVYVALMLLVVVGFVGAFDTLCTRNLSLGVSIGSFL